MKNDGSTIDLGATARSPEDVMKVEALGLQFAEVPIKDPTKFAYQVATYRELAKTLEIYYLCHGPREGDPNDIEGLENVYLPKVKRVIPLMVQLDVGLLTVHLWFDSRFVEEHVIRFKIEILKDIIHAAEKEGILVCIENLSEDAEDLSVAFNALPSLYMTLDLGHAQLLTDKNTSHQIISQFPKRIKHIHLHDNRGGDSPVDDIHLPPGQGIIDFDMIFEDLRKIGYERTVTLELKPHEIEACLGFVKDLLRLCDQRD
jgi:sugar phosphate isomerase/epimerase